MVNEFTKQGASPNLDCLRGMAVLMVLFDHLCRHFNIDRLGSVGVVDIGMFGVLLFFVHTALVLMQSMQRSGLSGTALVKNFYTRRCFRIYPLSALAVLAAVALHLQANGRGLAPGPMPQLLEVGSNLLLIQNLTYSNSIVGPLWSLPIEVQMYLVLPLLFLWKRRSIWALLLLWLVSGFMGHLPQVVPSLGWFTLLLYVPNFLPGVIAFTSAGKRVIPAHLWLPFILTLSFVFGMIPSRRSGGVLCLLLGFAIPRFREVSFGPLKTIAKWIATYSYGIYLAHSFCIYFALTRLHSWTIFITSMVVLPVLLYHGLEHPAIRLGTRLASKVSRVEVPQKIAVAA